MQLTSLGVAPEFISFKNTTMESDRYLCVRETGAQNSVAIFDLSAPPGAPGAVARRPITADSALMCPDKKVIALRAASPAGTPGDALQVFNLDTKAKLKAFSIAEPVEFWKWVSPSTLGLVTPASVYHWDVSSGGVDAPPVKVFDRTANLSGAQIIAYRASDDGKWCALVGIAPGSAERPALARGVMQLFSREQAKSQALEAHAAAFATARFAGRPAETPPSTVIAFAQKVVREGGAVVSKLHVIELGVPPGGGGGAAQKRQAELFFPAEFADDFPVSLQVSGRYGLVYVVTKLGLLFVYDLETATAIYRNRISPDPIFLAAPSDSTGGLLAVNRRGQVLLATVNEAAVVPFVAQQLGNLDLALALAKRGGLPGAEALVGQQFERLCASGAWKEAAECAAESPQGSLRTAATLARLRAAGAAAAAGQKPPILVYLGLLLARGQLNAAESAELGRLTMRQGRKEPLLGWWRDGKLAPGEELGDLLAQAGDKEAALSCYKGAGSTGKTIALLAESGDAAALQAFTGQSGQRLDYMALLQQLMASNPSGAVSLAKMAVAQSPPAADANAVADLFLQRNMVREATAFLLDYLTPADRPGDAALQTKLLEVNLVTNPQVADAVLANGSLTHYDRPKVAQLCEKSVSRRFVASFVRRLFFLFLRPASFFRFAPPFLCVEGSTFPSSRPLGPSPPDRNAALTNTLPQPSHSTDADDKNRKPRKQTLFRLEKTKTNKQTGPVPPRPAALHRPQGHPPRRRQHARPRPGRPDGMVWLLVSRMGARVPARAARRQPGAKPQPGGLHRARVQRPAGRGQDRGPARGARVVRGAVSIFRIADRDQRRPGGALQVHRGRGAHRAAERGGAADARGGALPGGAGQDLFDGGQAAGRAVSFFFSFWIGVSPLRGGGFLGFAVYVSSRAFVFVFVFVFAGNGACSTLSLPPSLPPSVSPLHPLAVPSHSKQTLPLSPFPPPSPPLKTQHQQLQTPPDNPQKQNARRRPTTRKNETPDDARRRPTPKTPRKIITDKTGTQNKITSPLINVCDRHGMVPDLVAFLYAQGLLRYIEGYAQKVSPAKTPLVVGALLDAGAPDDFITALISSVRSLVPVDQLTDEVERRNRLKLLTPVLEQLIGEGSQDPHVHDALGKIVVDTNNNPEHFMATNPYYNPLVVGK